MANYTIRGELGAGDIQVLVAGISVSLAALVPQTILTVPSNVSGVVLTHYSFYSPTGTLPTSVAIAIDGQPVILSPTALASLTSANFIVGQFNPGSQATAGAGLLITATSSSAAVGASVLMDLMGFYL